MPASGSVTSAHVDVEAATGVGAGVAWGFVVLEDLVGSGVFADPVVGSPWWVAADGGGGPGRVDVAALVAALAHEEASRTRPEASRARCTRAHRPTRGPFAPPTWSTVRSGLQREHLGRQQLELGSGVGQWGDRRQHELGEAVLQESAENLPDP